MTQKINYRKLDNGEPVCNLDCEYYCNSKCLIRGHGIYLSHADPTFDTPCIPGLREQRDLVTRALLKVVKKCNPPAYYIGQELLQILKM